MYSFHLFPVWIQKKYKLIFDQETGYRRLIAKATIKNNETVYIDVNGTVKKSKESENEYFVRSIGYVFITRDGHLFFNSMNPYQKDAESNLPIDILEKYSDHPPETKALREIVAQSIYRAPSYPTLTVFVSCVTDEGFDPYFKYRWD